jgi:glycerol-1-phosphate dehydrogenase [NAD(P)+]
MQLPREVIVGKNILDKIGDICKRLGFSKSILVVMGLKTKEIVGHRIVEILKASEFAIDQFVANSLTLWDVRAIEERIIHMKPQVVMGIGGGSIIDIAKLSSARKDVSFISVPTTASHDGIASPLCSIKGLNTKYSILAHAPMAILADTSVIIEASHRFTASGCGDIVAKLTAVSDWKLAHKANGEYYGEYAASLALMSAKLVIENAQRIKPGGEDGLRVLLEALISDGVAMSIAGSSRPGSGSEHLFSHALDRIAPKPALHGEQCGLGTIMMAHLHNLNWGEIRETLKKVGAPITANDLGIEPKYIVEALVRSCSIRPERYTILNEKPLSRYTAEKLAKSTYVID